MCSGWYDWGGRLSMGSMQDGGWGWGDVLQGHRPLGLVVWFVLRVDEVPGSIPGAARAHVCKLISYNHIFHFCFFYFLKDSLYVMCNIFVIKMWFQRPHVDPFDDPKRPCYCNCTEIEILWKHSRGSMTLNYFAMLPFVILYNTYATQHTSGPEFIKQLLCLNFCN